MIERYEIKKINNKDILFIYLNIDNEYSILNMNKQTIKDYIHNINFKGHIVAIVAAGVLIDTIILDNNKIEKKLETNLLVPNTIIKTNINNLSNEETQSPENSLLNIDNNNNNNNQTTNNTTNIIENTNNTKNNNKITNNNSNNTTKPKETINTNTNSNSNNKATNTNNSSNVTSNINNKESDNNPEIIDNNTYITLKKSNGTIIKMELEEYVIGVLGAEMPASFNSEALKAGAIIARTYALKANSKGNILKDNESNQSYKTTDELKNMWNSNFNNYYNKIKDAVTSTKGNYLTYNGTIIEAVYHSTSNGKTESSAEVWGNFYPYLISVDSKYDTTNSSFEKEISLSYEEISNKLNQTITSNSIFNILSKTEGNRVKYIEVDDKTYKGTDFRNLLGLRSADFDIQLNEKDITFTTRGYGHGVGLSQYGANGMAKNGYNYKQILSHYYPGTTLTVK